MRRTRSALAAVLTCALVAACASADDDGPFGGGEPADGVDDLELVAHLDPADAHAVGATVTAFGFDLLAELSDGTENVIVSPLSVATMLSMVLAGADGETADAMAEVLHLDDPRDVRSGALLASLAKTSDTTLSVANALWANPDFPFEQAYLDVVTGFFDAVLEEGDLGAQHTADAIDDWVAEETEGLIDGIAEELSLPDPAAVLVLLNAVYFLGEWTTQFDPSDTRDEPFAVADGSSVEVPLMRMRDIDVAYAVRPDYRMVRLPYGADERYAMEILLPDQPGGLPALIEKLDADEWRAAVAELGEQRLDEVVVPRFEVRWSDELTSTLIDMGMGPAFGPGADFTAMSPANPWLETVVHKTYLRVDEEGTEAAAVTGGEMAVSAPLDPLVFRVDRPFAFTISDSETGTVLFTGTVSDPTRE